MSENIAATDGPPREVRTERSTERGPAVGAVSRARFDAPVEDVWRLFTDAEQLRQWNAVHGDLRLGGEYSIPDNASGKVLRCDPPTMFRVSWIYQDNYSELEVRLGALGEGATVVEIEHIMRPEDVTSAGMSLSEGLAAAGMGWDMGLHTVGRYLRGELKGSPSADLGAEPSAEDLARYGEYEQAWQQVANEALAH
jgi:uncharacterized protein YndB with AHSA1/START domain